MDSRLQLTTMTSIISVNELIHDSYDLQSLLMPSRLRPDGKTDTDDDFNFTTLINC